MNIFRHILIALLLVLVQVLLLNRIHLLGCGTPLLYVYFVMINPRNMPRWQSLPLAFLLGLVMDSFTNTPGVASFSLTLTAFVQSYVLELYLDQNDDDDYVASLFKMGWLKYSSYALLLTLVFCLSYFMVEAFSFYQLMQWLMAAGISWALTFCMVLAIGSIRR